MKVAFTADDLNLVVGNTLLHCTPASSQFQGCFHALCTRIHGQNAVISEVFVDELLVLTQGIVIEGTRGKAEFVGLILQSLNNARVAMTLIHSRIGRKEVEILLPFDIPHINVLASMKHHWQGVIVVSAISLFKTHQMLAGSRLSR